MTSPSAVKQVQAHNKFCACLVKYVCMQVFGEMLPSNMFWIRQPHPSHKPGNGAVGAATPLAVLPTLELDLEGLSSLAGEDK